MRNKVALMMTAAAVLCAATSAQAGVKETTIYSFTGGNDGSFPHGGVIGDGKGNYYGVTTSGGAGHSGVVFELSAPKGGATTWTQTTLYSFTGGSDGANPQAALTRDAKGNLYGTTYSGGANGEGVAFKLHKQAGIWKYSLLWSFTGGNDGGAPSGALSMDSAGNIYGTTTQGRHGCCRHRI
ncbi:MAG: choice-of-anchor tandem repeat GloVer-containing protein [Rhizomicrobium sp.]